jgi:cytidylate kinase
MIITIDGPAGSGKSTAAKGLARRLGFEFLDTGATYRAVALAALRAGVGPADEALAGLLARLRLEMPPGGKVLLDGEDVTGLIRTPQVTAASSELAVVPIVRQRLTELQRAIAAGRDMVCEGRDQGTVVFPDAACKFFLTASLDERTRRRQREMEAGGETVDAIALRADIEVRDKRDAERDVAPMRRADDAILLDTTGLSVDEVVDRMEQEVRRLLAGRHR